MSAERSTPSVPLSPAPNGYPIKLVRDFTAAIINSSGEPGDLWYGPLPEGEDAGKWLIKKLVEEVAEFVAEPGERELVDVYAVVDAIAARMGWDLAEAHLNDARGGFRDVVMMYGRHPEFDVGPMSR